jgi:hypothetical protein
LTKDLDPGSLVRPRNDHNPQREAQQQRAEALVEEDFRRVYRLPWQDCDE